MALTIHPFTRRGLVSLGVVLLVAAVLRLDQLGITDYDYDSAAYNQLALNFATGKIIPRLGLMVSWGFATPPIHLYLLALPFAFSGNSTVATGFIRNVLDSANNPIAQWVDIPVKKPAS